MIFLLVPGLLAWAIYQRHWRLVIAFGVTLGGLILLPLPWLPTWPLAWLAAVGRYADYTVFDPPLVMLAGSTWLAGIVAVLLLLWTVGCWWHAPEHQGMAFDWALSMVAVTSALVAPRTTHVYQLMLLLPLFFVFTRMPKNGVITVVEIGLLVGLWLIDIMFFPPTSNPQHVVWQHWFISPILPVGLTFALLRFSPPLARKGANPV